MFKLRVAASLLLGVLSVNAYAGAYNPEPLTIGPAPAWLPDMMEAKGSMGGVRFSTNDLEEIGCRVAGRASGYVDVQCQAVDADGNRLACVSAEPAIVAAAQSATTFAWIWFTTDSDIYTDPENPDVGTCERLYVSYKSFHIPDTRNQSPGGTK